MHSSLKLPSCTPLGKEQTKKIKTIWQSLQDNNDSLEFRHAVDWQKMGLHDYPNFVSHPMDLGTINKKLREQRYHSVEEVLDDFQLIWDNCKVYNEMSSWIYDLADKLEGSFKKMVRTYLPTIALPGPVAKPVAAAPKVQQFFGYNQKIRFTDRLKILKPEELGLLVSKISEICPKAFREVQGNRAQILVDSIEQSSFKAILAVLESLEEPEDILQKRQKN